MTLTLQKQLEKQIRSKKNLLTDMELSPDARQWTEIELDTLYNLYGKLMFTMREEDYRIYEHLRNS